MSFIRKLKIKPLENINIKKKFFGLIGLIRRNKKKIKNPSQGYS